MIATYPDPSLTTPTNEFDFINPPEDPAEIATTLMQVINNMSLISISANQLRLPYRAFVLRGAENNIVCFNPKIVYSSEESELLDEACPSFPGVTVKVKRSKEIRVRFQTPTGVTSTHTFSGLTARAFQHELDHLDGVLFYNRANRYHREKALKNGRR
ncbi:Def N-formylmethionyl-tRNA deformylase [uncultured Caudovirales phage]|uniref:Def N-formylmethionyl-tRNA deformylase n=1 Tax=uncultured Caudovirales phage TaxID=2100421 RepID=A0A6J7X143_9CAUD|nr:Def N-formylmethionyl-tRNA deformylase [uncultured Caudovirales phage]